jgi:hypothetical protein
MEPENSDKELVRAAGTAVTKGILYVCLVVTAAFWFSSCELKEEIIKQCEDSCSSNNTHMESVTARECICTSVKNELMVLPR